MKPYKIKNILILLITIVVSVGTAWGQSTDSLNHYLEVAARNNPGLNANFLAYKASWREWNRQAYGRSATISVFLKPMDIVGGSQIADFTLMRYPVVWH